MTSLAPPPMHTPISIALIGAGGIGAYHLECLEKLEREGLMRLVAIADPTADRFPEVRDRLRARGVVWHANYLDMLGATDELDAAVIATPVPFHLEMTLACLERGLFVNLEKPPVPLIQQLEELIHADRDHRVNVGFQMIASRGIQELKTLIAGGRLGTVRSIRAGGCWPRRDSYYQRASWAGRMTLNGQPVFDGPATNALAHVVHNIMFLAGADRDGFSLPVEVEGELYRARPIESYDVAAIRGRFASGIEFSFAASHATEANFPFVLEARGDDGWARLSEDGARLQTSLDGDLECPETTQELIAKNYREFIRVLQGERPGFQTALSDTRGYVKSTNAMLLSSGGIHDIEPAAIREYGEGKDRGFDVSGLYEAIKEHFSDGCSLRDAGCTWATAKSKAIDLAGLESISLDVGQATPRPQ